MTRQETMEPSPGSLKVYVGELEIGMYVCGLDKPWLETDFPLQGFPIHNEKTLRALQQTCAYVFVDMKKTPVEIRQRLLRAPVSTRVATDQNSRIHSIPPPGDAVSFQDELERAGQIYQDSRKYITKALKDARLGHAIDADNARTVVEQMAESLMRNQHALLWLTHIKARDEYTLTHCINVSILAMSFGRFLGISGRRLIELGLGALLHDLGKMQVPDAILNKPGRLTEAEFAIMKKHPEYGYQLLVKHDDTLPAAALDIVRHHHERLDGNGYPDRLPAMAIPEDTRIVSIVDVYDAVTSDRVYHDGMTPHDALGNLLRWAPGNFDQNLVEKFIRCLGIYPVGSLVELNTGEVAVVATFRDKHRLKPVVLMILDANKKPYPKRVLLNLADPHWQDEEDPPRIVGVLEQDAYGINLAAILAQEAMG